MAEHCISALRLRTEENLFRSYVADALRGIPRGESPVDRFTDILALSKRKPDGRTDEEKAEDIKTSIAEKLRAMKE